MHTRLTATIGSVAVFLSLPVFALAAEADTTKSTDLTDEIISIIEEQPVMPAPMPITDGKGGGGVGMIYPGPMGGIQVDASVTKNVTPDFIAINAYCDIGRKQNRDTTRDTLQQLFVDIKNAVGSDGVVRRSGGIGIYPYYDQTGRDTGQFSGNLNLMIRVTRPAAAQRIFDYVEDKNCGPNWDVRLVDTLRHETSVIDELTKRLQDRKALFEKMLNRKLTTVNSASLYTWVDGYATYDPDTNKAEATSTLSVSYDPGENATIRRPRN
jgi:hypothetical protein